MSFLWIPYFRPSHEWHDEGIPFEGWGTNEMKQKIKDLYKKVWKIVSCFIAFISDIARTIKKKL